MAYALPQQMLASELQINSISVFRYFKMFSVVVNIAFPSPAHFLKQVKPKTGLTLSIFCNYIALR